MKRIIGKIDPKDKHVAIWGAGFSGLVLGYYLKSEGYKVTIYEKSNHIGGKIHTKKTHAGLVEKGPNALFMNADSMDLLNALKLEPLAATKKLRRLIMFKNKPRRAIHLSLISKVIFNGGKRPPLVSDGLSVADFFKPLLNQKILDNFLSPVLGGIYAATADQLHFKSLFDEVAQTAQFQSYWGFFRKLSKLSKNRPKLDVNGSVSFEGGMQTLIDHLGRELKSEIKLNNKGQFRINGNTIICTDAMTASELTKNLKPDISKELTHIKYQEISSATVFLKREIKSLQKAFGVLIPLGSDYNSIGILNNKAIFPDNNRNVFSYTLIAKKNLTETEIHADLKSLSSDFETSDISYLDQGFWEKGLPIYDLQRYLTVKKLHQICQQEDNLAIFGNYVAGISLREMITAARLFAKNPNEYQTID